MAAPLGLPRGLGGAPWTRRCALPSGGRSPGRCSRGRASAPIQRLHLHAVTVECVLAAGVVTAAPKSRAGGVVDASHPRAANSPQHARGAGLEDEFWVAEFRCSSSEFVQDLPVQTHGAAPFLETFVHGDPYRKQMTGGLERGARRWAYNRCTPSRRRLSDRLRRTRDAQGRPTLLVRVADCRCGSGRACGAPPTTTRGRPRAEGPRQNEAEAIGLRRGNHRRSLTHNSPLSRGRAPPGSTDARWFDH